MDSSNAMVLTTVGLQLIDRLMQVQTLQATMAAEGRHEPTQAELDALFAGDDTARKHLQDVIDAAKAGA